jgi:tRNA G18 (ribose-2'-O)-methylase SpoU
VAWSYHADALSALADWTGRGYEAVAVETTERAVPVERLDWPRKVCLVLGNEVAGVSGEVLAACSRQVRIPMHGVKNTLNVAVAFGIAAYHASSALRRSASAGPAADPR